MTVTFSIKNENKKLDKVARNLPGTIRDYTIYEIKQMRLLSKGIYTYLIILEGPRHHHELPPTHLNLSIDNFESSCEYILLKN